MRVREGTDALGTGRRTDGGATMAGMAGTTKTAGTAGRLPTGLAEALDGVHTAIFDFDGTLAYTQGNNLSVYQRVFAELGVDGVTDEEYSARIGNPVEEHVRHIAECHGLAMTEREVRAVAGRFIEIADAYNDEHLPTMFSYLTEALGHLGQARCLVVTANKRGHVDRVLRAWGIRDSFDDIRTLHNGYSKRAEYERLMREPPCPGSAAEMIVFEDSRRYLADAKGLGMLTVGVVHARSGRHSVDHADFRIDMRGER